MVPPQRGAYKNANFEIGIDKLTRRRSHTHSFRPSPFPSRHNTLAMFGLAPVCTLALLAASGIAGPVRTKTALDAHPSSTMAIEARYGSYGYVDPTLQDVGTADPDCNPSPPPPAPSCNTGELQCCNSVQDVCHLLICATVSSAETSSPGKLEGTHRPT